MIFEANMWFWNALWIVIVVLIGVTVLYSLLSKLPVIGPYFNTDEDNEDLGTENNNSFMQGIATVVALVLFVVPAYLFYAFAANGDELFIIQEEDGKTVGEEEMIYYGDDEMFGLSVFLGNNIFTRMEPSKVKFVDEYKGWSKPLYNATNGPLYITRHTYGMTRTPIKDMGVVEAGQTGAFSHSGFIKVGCHSKLPEELTVEVGRTGSAYITRITEKPDAECSG